jgi:hypothetical protein
LVGAEVEHAQSDKVRRQVEAGELIVLEVELDQHRQVRRQREIGEVTGFNYDPVKVR